MNSKGKEIAEAITKEVAEWPGAEVSIVEPKGRGHPKAKLKFAGKIMQVPFSATPTSSKTIHHTLADVRRTLRKLGAERPKPDPTPEEDEAEYRPKNDGAAKRANPITVEKAKPEKSVAEKLTAAGLGPDGKEKPAEEDEPSEAAAKIGAGLQDAIDYAGGDKSRGRVAERAVQEADEIRREFEARVAGIVDGVYFGLPADVYHAVPRLSSSGVQKIDVSPATFWRGSWFDPDRPDPDEDETIWQLLGRAYHVARLEPHLFEKLYVRELDKAEAPEGTLITGTDLDKQLTEWDLKKSGTVLDKAERLAEAGFEAGKLWPLIKREWEDARGTRTALPAKHYDQMITDRDRISKNSKIAPLLNGGEAEVSIFWTDEHGVQMKARVDYLTRDWWVDFKTFDNSRGKPVGKALSDAVQYNRYHIQAVVYREAIEAVRVGGLDVIEAETEDQRNLVAALRIRPGELTCWYVFQEKGGIPNLLAREFPFYLVPYSTLFNEQITDDEDRRAAVREATKQRTQLFMRGAYDVLEAKKAFVLYSQVYGDSEPWFPLDPIGRFNDEDFHPYWLDGGNG